MPSIWMISIIVIKYAAVCILFIDAYSIKYGHIFILKYMTIQTLSIITNLIYGNKLTSLLNLN